MHSGRIADQPQPWVPLQYPAATLVMPPLPPQFAPQRFFGFHPPLPPLQLGKAAAEENKTIWVGDLNYWMDENYLHRCFGHTGEVISIKVIRNKQTGKPEGYGFVEFLTHAAAEKVIQTFANISMPNTDQPFRLNWATFSTGDRRSDIASNHSIFVGDLAPDVSDALLQETFSSKYPSVKGAKVVIDANTGRSKGYGFVRFGNDNEKTLAMTEMNGVYCLSRPMRIGAATPRKLSGGSGSSGSSSQDFQSDEVLTNTTVSILVNLIAFQNILDDGYNTCFCDRNEAEEALQELNGTIIGKQAIRLSWGRNPTNKLVLDLAFVT
ncbi:Polyadenylate-binding protein RBP47 [Apostasia shenzhenica]|uniref:Polyadenylate-binding protein RBP47 n=1 Tax=Apostasia shenzhenica TaxID=1088818 RepID=A0A2I0A3A2_9ASPA|nr:Polyadenylate-binding protein RBP47 [Apostasia shenzhenica]